MRYAYAISDGLGNQIEQLVPYLYIVKQYPHLDPVYAPTTHTFNPDTTEFWRRIAIKFGNQLRVADFGCRPSWWHEYKGCFSCVGDVPWPGIDEMAFNRSPHCANEVDHRNRIIPPDEAERIMREEIPIKWKRETKQPSFDVILCNGGTNNSTWARKKFTRYNELAQVIKDRHYSVASVGLKDEYIQGTEDMTGIGLGPTMDLISRCKQFVSNDTGLYHFASVIGVPTVVIFTATSPTKNHHPIFHRFATVVNGWDVAGCGAPCQEHALSWQLKDRWQTCRQWKCAMFDIEPVIVAMGL